MEGLILLMGYLFWAFINGWTTIFVFFITVPNFYDRALFSGNLKEKLLGVLLWFMLAGIWFCWLYNLFRQFG